MTTTNTTAIKAARTILASQSLAAGATARGAIDLRTSLGGLATLRITNGATGPTAQCVCRVMVAHDDGVTPATGARGATWKQIWEFGGGTAANAITEQPFEFGPGVMHMQAEFTGNTGQAVTIEAIVSEVTSARTQP